MPLLYNYTALKNLPKISVYPWIICAHRVKDSCKSPTKPPPYHHAMSEEGTRRREVTTNAHCIGKRSMDFYLSPDLALKQSVDLLILAFFIESKPLQPNGDGEKDHINELRRIPAYLSWLSTLNPDIAMCSHLPHCLLAGPWYLSGTSRGPSWRY